MPYRAVPKSELEFLLDVERALADVVKPLDSMPPPSPEQESSVIHALGALRRAGLSKARAAKFIRALRAIGIQKPGRFVIGLRSDYAHASYVRTGDGQSNYLAEDEFESVGLLLQTVLFFRPDMPRIELLEVAVILANLWLEEGGYDLPFEAPPFLHLEAFHAGVTVSECAIALRELAAWGKSRVDARDVDGELLPVVPSPGEAATPGLPSELTRDEQDSTRRPEGVDPQS